MFYRNGFGLLKQQLIASCLFCIVPNLWAMLPAPVIVNAAQVDTNSLESPRAVIELGAGFVMHGFYQNEFFGLKYEFPKNWNVNKARVDYENTPRSDLKSRDSDQKLNKLEEDSHLLLEVSRAPASALRVHPPYIRVVSELLTENSKIHTPYDVLDLMRQITSDSFSDHVILDPSDYSFDGQKLVRMDIARSVLTATEKHTLYVSYVVGIRKGRGLIFQIVSDNREDLEDLFTTLNSLKFKSEEQN